MKVQTIAVSIIAVAAGLWTINFIDVAYDRYKREHPINSAPTSESISAQIAQAAPTPNDDNAAFIKDNVKEFLRTFRQMATGNASNEAKGKLMDTPEFLDQVTECTQSNALDLKGVPLMKLEQQYQTDRTAMTSRDEAMLNDAGKELVRLAGQCMSAAFREHGLERTTGSSMSATKKSQQQNVAASDNGQPTTADTPITQAADDDWKFTDNKNGVVMTSKNKNATIYLGNSCDANSPEYGQGKWEWANAGWSVTVGDKTFRFPRAEPPIDPPSDDLGRCEMQ